MKVRTRSWLFPAAAAIVVAVPTSASAHRSNGGDSISSAPPLPLGQTVASGWDVSDAVDNTGEYGEFWPVQLSAGDRIVIDWARTSTQCGAGFLRVFEPAVTDFTISRANPTADLNSNSATKYEFSWIAPRPGNWTLFFYDGFCRQVSYTLNAIVQRFTTTALMPPPTLIAAGGTMPVHGSVTGVSAGKVLAVVRGPKGFATIRKVVSLRNGSYSWSLRLRIHGVYHVRVSYPGDNGHRPSSSRTYTIRVAS